MKRKLFIIFLLNSLFFSELFAQTDTSFWFAVPKVTISHCQSGTCPGAKPVYIRLASMGLPATVTISQPANPLFKPKVINMAANSAATMDMTPYLEMFQDSVAGTVLNHGLHISSTNLITAYWEEDEYWNPDIFSLKGKNSLGTEFYTPFQNLWSNGVYTPDLPYSAFDIVATQDNTTITITPTANLASGQKAGVPFTIHLNKGQTYSCKAASQSAAGHLGGSHIVSDKPIAVTVKDDSVSAGNCGCRDLEGDQIVPAAILGRQYIIMRGRVNLTDCNQDPVEGTRTGERAFIVATQPNTTISFYYTNNTTSTRILDLSTTITNAGQEYAYEIKNNAVYVMADKPIYVYHIAGFGCEMGGGLLPKVDACTGSYEVSFTRSNSQDFYLNLMTREGGESTFYIQLPNGTNYQIPASYFEKVISPDSTKYPNWMALKADKKLFNIIPMNQACRVYNTSSLFHMALINGGRNTGCKYGYFSDFNSEKGSAVISQTNSDLINSCFGDTVQLRAWGGLSYHWVRESGSTVVYPDYLSDPYSATPTATPPSGTYDYFVTVHRTCSDTVCHVKVLVSPELVASYNVDRSSGCAPLNILYTDKSVGATAIAGSHLWDFESNDTIDRADNVLVVPPFYRTFQNKTDSVLVFQSKLIVQNNQCAKSFTRPITVYPEIDAGFNFTGDSISCNPLTVPFTNKSRGDTAQYVWEFGDGSSSNQKNPVHTYSNFTHKDTTYRTRLIGISPDHCKDTVQHNFIVHPYLKAGFTVDSVKGCAPYSIRIFNTSEGQVNQYHFTFNDGKDTIISSPWNSFTHIYQNTTDFPIDRKLSLTVSNTNGGCTDTFSRYVTIYPEVNAAFTKDNSLGCNPLTVKFTNQDKVRTAPEFHYNWDFGDNANSGEISPSHQYINNDTLLHANIIRLIASYTGTHTCRDTAVDTVRVWPYIKASFAVKQASGCAVLIDTITNPYSSWGGIKNFVYDFGDGQSLSTNAHTFAHQFTNTSNSKDSVYRIRLTVTTANCSDTMSIPVTVYPQVKASFLYSGNKADCNPLTTAFTNNSSPSATLFYWDFGDGTSTSDHNPKHQFINNSPHDTTFKVTLTATSDRQCSQSVSVNLTVFPYILSGFTVDKNDVCSGDSILFRDNSKGGVTGWNWDFGDGSAAYTGNIPPAHQYSNLGTQPKNYFIKLMVSNHANCPNLFTDTVTIYPQVTANFQSDTAGCQPFAISFTNKSTNATTYFWSFGDGSTSNNTNPAYIYHNYTDRDTTFRLKVLATSDYLCADSTSQVIHVFHKPKARFNIPKTIACPPFEVNIQNTSVTSGSTFTWNFADRTKDTVTSDKAGTLSHVFYNNPPASAIRTYSISLHAETAHGCSDNDTVPVRVYPKVTASFSSLTDSACTPFTYPINNTTSNASNYNWWFGDGFSSQADKPVHVFYNYGDEDTTYRIRLLATSPYSCTDTTSRIIKVYHQPRAIFSVAKNVDCPPFDVTLQNQSTGTRLTYNWDYGDNKSYTTRVKDDPLALTHAYSNDSTGIRVYTIRLHVVNSGTCASDAYTNINVYPNVTANFRPDTAGCSPFYVQFTNLSKNGDFYRWNMGDGLTSGMKNPLNRYVNLSLADTTFTVSLKTESRYGCSDSTTRKVTVYPSPQAEFAITPPLSTYPDATFNFTNNTNPGPWQYLWNLGDNYSTTNKDPGTHTYQHWGTFDIKLRAASEHCMDSISHKVYLIAPVPIAMFDSSSQGCAPHTAYFTNKSIYGNSYLWDFGDGSTSTAEQPVSHLYNQAGIYNVKLTVKGDGGESYHYETVTVYRLPEVNFELAPDTIMLPDEKLRCYNLSKYGTSYLWKFGDGETSTEKNPTHLYTVKDLGAQNISLTVWTDHQCVDSLVKYAAVKIVGAGYLRFPNAFSPSLDGPNGGIYKVKDINNDVFHPLFDGIMDYHLEIYSRWGARLFESDNVMTGWDGYYQGKLCKQDVYVWKVKATFYNGKMVTDAGTVTLLIKKNNN